MVSQSNIQSWTEQVMKGLLSNAELPSMSWHLSEASLALHDTAQPVIPVTEFAAAALPRIGFMHDLHLDWQWLCNIAALFISHTPEQQLQALAAHKFRRTVI